VRSALLYLLVLGCGSRQPPSPNEVIEPDPAWAKNYEQRASDGCACTDPGCLDRVHRELAAVEAQHGGMDEAPPAVQRAHGQFDDCWRVGTRDEGRDLDHAAALICGCADETCLRGAKIELLHLADKYTVSDVHELAARSPAAAAALDRSARCLADVTISATDYVAKLEQLTAELCGCKDASCGARIINERGTAFAKFIEVGDLGTQQTRVDELAGEWCRCFGELAAHELTKLSPFPSATRIDVHTSCH
jgi:hypothetical protein